MVISKFCTNHKLIKIKLTNMQCNRKYIIQFRSLKFKRVISFLFFLMLRFFGKTKYSTILSTYNFFFYCLSMVRTREFITKDTTNSQVD